MGGSVPTSTESPDDREERMTKVRLKYTPLFKRQPNVHGWGVVSLRDENGNRTETRGIEIRVTEKVGQSTLPPEDRIPDCLEGVPVQFREEPLARLLSKPLEDHLGPEESNRRD